MTTIKTYRKKPVEIQAVMWTGENLVEITEFVQGCKIDPMHQRWDDYVNAIHQNGLTIHTLEGEMKASIGDYIIKGVAGECYPCKPDIFIKTYEEVNKLCPKCGGELQQCENCENMGCTDCDGYIVTRDDVILCPECGAMCKAECDAQRAVGCGSCALFSDEDDEGYGWCELNQEPMCCIDECDDRLLKAIVE